MSGTRRTMVTAAIGAMLLAVWPPLAIAATKKPSLGVVVSSPVAGLPVPSVATLSEKFADKPGDMAYVLPRGVVRADVIAWYQTRLPWKKPWQDWTWCDGLNGKAFVSRIWTHVGTTDVLTVVIGADKNGSHPFIVVGADQSGPC